MKKTLRDVINFANSASRWTAMRDKDEPQTKLSYAVARMLKRCQKPIEDYNARNEDIRLNEALEDEKTKAVLMEGQQYKFSKQGLKKVVEEQRKLLDEEVEIEPYIATAVPANLSDDVRVSFEGFVITPGAEE